jgi:hypothetical protein
MSDPNYPWLSVSVSFKQSVSCGYDIIIDLKISGFDVDRHNLALISGLDLLANARFIERLPTFG